MYKQKKTIATYVFKTIENINYNLLSSAQQVSLIIYLCISLLFINSNLWCQSEVIATIKLDSTHLLIGDQLKGSIIVNTPQDEDIIFPIVSDYWKNEQLEILSLSNQEQKNATRGIQIISQKIAITFWDTGTYQLPPLPFAYNSTTTSDTIYAKISDIRVDYPLGITGDSTYMAPIKPILAESRTFMDYLYSILPYLLLLFGLIGVAIIIYVVVAMELPKQGEFQEYHTAISLIIRNYLYNRFQLKALEATTNQILQMVNYDYITERLQSELKEVLETSDLVKYAKASPLDSANEFAANFIRQLIKETLERLAIETEN